MEPLLEEIHDHIFNKYVFAESFTLPSSLSELRNFSEKLCKDVIKRFHFTSENSLSEGEETKEEVLNQKRNIMKNDPIGLEILIKTFDIINIVGKGNANDLFK